MLDSIGIHGRERGQGFKPFVILSLVCKGLAVFAKGVCAVVIYELRPCDGGNCVRGLW